jgi:hypothetical protein
MPLAANSLSGWRKKISHFRTVTYYITGGSSRWAFSAWLPGRNGDLASYSLCPCILFYRQDQYYRHVKRRSQGCWRSGPDYRLIQPDDGVDVRQYAHYQSTFDFWQAPQLAIIQIIRFYFLSMPDKIILSSWSNLMSSIRL